MSSITNVNIEELKRQIALQPDTDLKLFLHGFVLPELIKDSL